MIDTQKLIDYIASAPFPETEKMRLIELAKIATEEDQKQIYFLVKDFVLRFKEQQAGRITESEANNIRKRGQEVKTYFRKKAEEIYTAAEREEMNTLESQLSNL